MAKETMDTSETFDFGIVDTSAVGNMKAVESFLSDTPFPENEDELEEIDEEAERAAAVKKAKQAAAKKQAEAAKKSAEEILFEEEKEEEEGETGDDNEDAEKDKDADTTKGEGEKKTQDESNDYEILSKDLVKLGVFSQESETEPMPKTGAEFLAKFNKEKEAGAIQWIDSFLEREGEDRRDLFEAIFINGVDPREYLPIYAQVQNFEGMDMAVEDNQQLIFREFYKRIKFPSDKIEIKLQKSKDNGDLEEESKEFHKQIVSQDKETLATMEATKADKKLADQKADVEYKQNISKILIEKLKAKEFNGIPISQDIANKAFDFLYTKKYKTADNQLLTEFDKFVLETKRPENIEKRVLLALLKLTDFDFSKIAKRAVSKESNELFTTMAQRKAKKTETQTKQTSSSSKNWLEL